MKELLRRGLNLVRPRTSGDSEGERRKPLYVITISVSPSPLPLPKGAQLPEIGGLTLFRAKRVVGARELHLQQLGYFESRPAAEALLPQLEADWPAAVVELAVEAGMGSLDDTVVTQFQVLQPSYDAPAPRPASKETPAGQYYAVQLIRQNAPIDFARVPRLAQFRGLALYRVEYERDGTKTYGLRLGFFPDPAAARLVADSVRERFPRAALVPVSDREVGRVSGKR
jgi:hypothetical protein